MANYPETIANLRKLVNRNGAVYDSDKRSVFFAEDLNDVIDEIIAIETVLGIPIGDMGIGLFEQLQIINADIDALEGSGYITDSSVDTLINKRINPRVQGEASSATTTPTADTCDIWDVTALAVGTTIGAPTGTPVNGQKLIIKIKDNGVARAIAYNAIFRALGATLPTTTVVSKQLYLGCIYNSGSSKWEVVAVAQEA